VLYKYLIRAFIQFGLFYNTETFVKELLQTGVRLALYFHSVEKYTDGNAVESRIFICRLHDDFRIRVKRTPVPWTLIRAGLDRMSSGFRLLLYGEPTGPVTPVCAGARGG